MELPDPVEAIKFEMERRGLTVKDLEPMIGKSNRVYEILNHKRSLTLKMIWKLHEELGVPAESLIKPPQEKANSRLKIRPSSADHLAQFRNDHTKLSSRATAAETLFSRRH